MATYCVSGGVHEQDDPLKGAPSVAQTADNTGARDRSKKGPLTIVRSQKGQLTIVRSKKSRIQLNRPFFWLLAS